MLTKEYHQPFEIRVKRWFEDELGVVRVFVHSHVCVCVCA